MVRSGKGVRGLLAVGVALFAAIGLWFWSGQQAHVARAAVHELPRVEYGDVRPGLVFRAVVQWTNIGGEELRFVRAESDCGCLRATANDAVIAPGEQLVVECLLRPPAEPGILEVPYKVLLSAGHILHGVVRARVLAAPNVTPNSVVVVKPTDANWSVDVTIALPWDPGVASIRAEPRSPGLTVAVGGAIEAVAGSKIPVTIRGPVPIAWQSAMGYSVDDWREAVVFEVAAQGTALQLRTHVTLVRADALSVSPRKLILQGGHKGLLTMQNWTPIDNQPTVATDPPDCASVDPIGLDQFMITPTTDRVRAFDVIVICGESFARIPVVVLSGSD